MRVKTLLLFLILLSAPLWACDEILKYYKTECQMQDDYREYGRLFKEEFGVDIEYLTRYRALRFIKEDHWEARKEDFQCQPWMFYDPKPVTWIYWEKGAQRVKDIVESENAAGAPITLDRDRITDIHMHSITSELMGMLPTLKGASPGKIRSGLMTLPPGFTVSCDDEEVDGEAHKLLQNYDLKDSRGQPLVTAKLVKCGSVLTNWTNDSGIPAKTFYKGVVSYASTQVVDPELNRLLSFVEKKIEKFATGQGSEDYSPLDFIADVQRWYVSIHPFGDGNGRTSRLIQDYLTQRLGLPNIPSGRLQNDVMLSTKAYRARVKSTMQDNIAYFKGCLNEYKKSVGDLDKISCDCRSLYNQYYFEEQETLPVTGTPQCERADGSPVNSSIESFVDILTWMIGEGFYENEDL